MKIDNLRRYFKLNVFRNKSIVEVGGSRIEGNRKIFGYKSCFSYPNLSSCLNTKVDTLVIWTPIEITLGQTDLLKTLIKGSMYLIIENLPNEMLIFHENDFKDVQFKSITCGMTTYYVYWNPTYASPIRQRTDRVAMYFSGRIKTYEDQILYLMKLRDEYDIDCFMSINGKRDDFHDEFIRKMHVVDDFFQNHEDIYICSWEKRFRRLPTQNDRDAWKLSSATFNNCKCITMIENFQKEYAFEYDIVVKFRVDIITDHILSLPLSVPKNTVYLPIGGDWDFYEQRGINDHFAYGDFPTMKIYSTVFKNIEQYCEVENHGYHPESLLYYQLEKNHVVIERFEFVYTLHVNRHEPGEYW